MDENPVLRSGQMRRTMGFAMNWLWFAAGFVTSPVIALAYITWRVWIEDESLASTPPPMWPTRYDG